MMCKKSFTISIFLICLLILSCSAISEAAQKNKIIGKWKDTGLKSAPVYIFVADKNDIILYSATDKQNIKKIDTLNKQGNKYFSQLHKDLGEYYVIDKSNVLEIYDKQGLIRKCQPYTGSDFPLPIIQPSTAGTRKIDFVPTVEGDFQVQVDISADLPDGAVLSVSLSKHGLASNDRFIGTDFEKVPVAGGKASILIDAQKKPQPSLAAIVKGKYDVEVHFYPRWQENRAIAASAGITAPIETVKVISLNGVSKDAGAGDSEKKKAENRKWVMENVNQGMKWDAKTWESKFGKSEIYAPTSGNPGILRMYYFKEIDMTIQVNTQKQEIVTWADGKTR